jgi:hypothetical protein
VKIDFCWCSYAIDIRNNEICISMNLRCKKNIWDYFYDNTKRFEIKYSFFSKNKTIINFWSSFCCAICFKLEIKKMYLITNFLPSTKNEQISCYCLSFVAFSIIHPLLQISSENRRAIPIMEIKIPTFIWRIRVSLQEVYLWEKPQNHWSTQRWSHTDL